ncbi:MAG TPA: hypothetical protein ENI57_07070 [Ignavibacteria bacterium]|nr:hypothetical protein [Ignavibacteria bacterium]
MFNSIKIFFQATLERTLLITGINVALVVGVILNLINQGSAFISFDIAHLNFTKFILTFFVPFGVSVYSSARIRLKMVVGKRSKLDAKLLCVNCGETKMNIKKGQKIKECPKCGEKTKYKVIEINK